MTSRRRLVAAALLVGACVAACGEDGPRELGPAASSPPAGTRMVTCDLATDDGRLAFTFALGDDYAPATLETGEGCRWRRPAPPRTEDGEPTTDSVATVEWVGEAGSLQDVYESERRLVSDDGDDAVSDLRLTEDVPVFGETIGDRVRWDCFCDGLPNLTYVNQAAGVRLTWNASTRLQDQVEDEVRTALSSAGTR